jgi:outer membrane lipoprotein-sorting protein
MKSEEGIKLRVRHVLRGLVLLLLTVMAEAWAFDAQTLLQQMGQQKQGQAKFTELKYMAILDRPVKSSGQLAFQAPSRIEKITQEPAPESLVLDGETLTFIRAGKQVVIQLRSYPQVLAFVEAIRGLLLGDYQLLENTYRIDLTGGAEQWRMILTPRERRLSDVIKQIKINGGHGKLSAIEYVQNDGDYSVMKIEPLPLTATATGHP